MPIDNEKDDMECEKKEKDSKKKKGSNPAINIEPELEEERQPLTLTQRKQKARTMKRFAKKIARSRKRSMNRKATMGQLENRARKHAIKAIRTKVAGEKGGDYSNLSATEKAMIDKKVAKRAPAITRMTRKLLPKVRKIEADRRKSKNAAARDVNESFETLFIEACQADTKPKKRFHELLTKDGKVKHDKRFRFNKKAPAELEEDITAVRQKHKREKERLAAQQEREKDRVQTRNMRKKIRAINTEQMSTEDLLSVVENMHMSINELRLLESLDDKATKSGHLLETIEEVFDRGLDAWSENMDLEPEQYAMNRVNSFVSEGKAYDLDQDLLEGAAIIAKAIDAVHRQVAKGISVMDATWDVSRARGVDMPAKELAKLYAAKYDEPNTSNMKKHSLSTQNLYKKYGFRMNEAFTPAMLKKLKTAYASTGDRISTDNAEKMNKLLSGRSKKELMAIARADIKWLSTSAQTKLISMGVKASEIKESYMNEAFEAMMEKSCDGKGGAGEEGTDKLVKKYKKDSPEESYKEAKEDYEIYHKTFSSAVQHAMAQVERRGYDVDWEDWDTKVALGPKKPSKGKTNSYTIGLTKNNKEVRQKLHMQVYYDEGRYELNMYIQ